MPTFVFPGQVPGLDAAAAPADEMSDAQLLSELTPQAQKAALPPAAAAPQTQQFSDADMLAEATGATPTAPAAPVTPQSAVGLGERLFQNANQAFWGTTTGEGIAQFRAGVPQQTISSDAARAAAEARAANANAGLSNFGSGEPSAYEGIPVDQLQQMAAQSGAEAQKRHDEYGQVEKERNAKFEAMPPWYSEPGVGGKAAAGLAALFGQVAGGLPAVENLAGGEGLVARRAGEAALPYLAKEAAKGAAVGAPVGAAASAVTQSQKIERGAQEDFSPEELAQQALFGGLLFGGMHVAPELAATAGRAVRDLIAKRRGVTPDAVDPASVTPEETAHVQQDPQLKALIDANGITDPNDPRAATLEQRLNAKRKYDYGQAPERPETTLDTEPSIERNMANGPGRGAARQGAQFDAEVERQRQDRAGIEGQAAKRVDTMIAQGLATDAERDGLIQGIVQSRLPTAGREGPAQPPEVIQQGQSRDLPTGDRGTIVPGEPVDAGAGAGYAANYPQGVPLSRGQKMELLDRYGHVPETVEQQHALYGRMAAEKAAQAETDARGPLRTADDTGAADSARTSPASRPMEDAAANRTYGEVENTARPVSEGMDRVASGTSDRPFRAESTDGATPEQLGQFEDTARTAAEDARRASVEDLERQWQERAQARESDGRSRFQDAEERYADAKASNRPAPQDESGRYPTDQDGFVLSDKGGPIKFGDQKQAARWIVKEGHAKSPDQVFEIENHPGKKGGFTVRERDRVTPEGGAQEAPQQQVAPMRLNGPARPEAPAPRAEADMGNPISEQNHALEDVGLGSDEQVSRRADTAARDAAAEYEAAQRAAEEHYAAQGEEWSPETRYAQDDGAAAAGEAAPAEPAPTERPATGRASEDVADRAVSEPGSEPPAAREGAVQEGHDQGAERPGAERRSEAPAGQAGDVPEGRSAGEADSGGAGRAGRPDQGGEPVEEHQQQLSQELGSKLSAGGVFDPANYRWVADALHKTWGLTKEEANAWADGVERMARLLKPREKMPGEKGAIERLRTGDGSGRGSPGGIGHFLKVAAYSNDGILRGLAWRFGRNSEAKRLINDFADIWHAPAGKVGKAVGETYEAAWVDKASHYLNRLSEVLKPFEKLRADDQAATLRQIGQLVTNPERIRPGSPVHDAAVAITKMLRELHDYQTKAGIEMGNVKRGYLPRVEDAEAIMRRPDEFKADVVRYLTRKEGMSREMAQQAADAWHQRVLLGDLGVSLNANDFVHIASANGNPTHTKGRLLGKAADLSVKEGGLADWYLRNPAEILPQYVMRSARRAEWTRRMGPKLEKWDAFKQALIKEGAGSAIPEIVRTVESATGMMSSRVGGGYRRATGALRAWGSVEFLSRAVYSSLSEPFLIGMRTGNMTDALRAYGTTLHQWTVGVRNTKSAKHLREMVEDLGLISQAQDSLALQQFSLGLQTGQLSKAIQAGFFKKTGLHAYTDATRIASFKYGQIFVRRLANDIAGEGRIGGIVPTGSAFETSAKMLLRELGIDDAKHMQFSKWVRSHEAAGGVGLEEIAKGGEMGQLYRTAMSRFLDQTILRPTGATRARYANHPLGSLVYNLQSYNYAFQKNVLNRTYNLATQAGKANGLNPLERAQMLAPLALMPALFGVNMALNELRDVLYYDPAKQGKPPETMSDKLMRGASRTGLTGTMDLPLNMITGARYQRDPATALLGPIFGGQSELFSNVVGLTSDHNSTHTNTAERKAGRAVYNTLIGPAINAAASVLPGRVGALAGAAFIQMASHPVTREAAVRAFAGPPAPTKRKR